MRTRLGGLLLVDLFGKKDLINFYLHPNGNKPQSEP